MQFKQGMKLKAIYMNNEESITADEIYIHDIEVIMEHGQMDFVPWAVVTYKNGEVFKWNLACCQGVRVL